MMKQDRLPAMIGALGAAIISLHLVCLPLQADVTEWTWDWDSVNRNWSGDDSGNDNVRYIEALSDGNYILTGYISQDSEWDLFVMLINPSGTILEYYTYDGGSTVSGNVNDYGRCVRKTSDGGYIIAGVANAYGQGEDAAGDILLIKLDEYF